MVRLKNDLKESKNGNIAIPAGGLLGNEGFGVRTREIYSMMIGRAMFSMMDSTWEEKRVIIAPRWEGKQLNWHVVVKP